MPFSYEAPVVVITISKHVRTNHPDSSTYSELYQLSTEFPRPLNDSAEDPAIPENTDNLPFHFVDVSKLNVVVIDKNTIRDASKFKMTK